MKPIEESKKQREWRHIQVFQKEYSQFPKCCPIQDENPDCLIPTPEGTVGIEVTGLFWPQMLNMELPQKVYQAQNRILERCIEISKSEEVPAVYVIIQFRWETIAYDIEKTASALVSLVKKVVPGLSKIGQYRSDINPLDGILQFVVKSPNHNGVNWCDDHRWERAIVHNLMPNPIEEIQQRINEKNAKHADYLKKCTKCWLLITAEGWQFPQALILTQETKNHVFRSTFEKTFFLEVIDQEPIELRTES